MISIGVRLDDVLVVVGAEALRHLARGRQLVVLVVREADRERLDRLGASARPSRRRPRMSRRRRRGTRRAARRRSCAGGPRRAAAPRISSGSSRSVARHGRFVAKSSASSASTVGSPPSNVSTVRRRQACGRRERRPRATGPSGRRGRRRARWSIERPAGSRDPASSAASSEAKLRTPVPACVEQRLLADAVAREQQAASAAVPQREGEHAVQLVHASPDPAPRRGAR